MITPSLCQPASLNTPHPVKTHTPGMKPTLKGFTQEGKKKPHCFLILCEPNVIIFFVMQVEYKNIRVTLGTNVYCSDLNPAQSTKCWLI